MEIVKCTPRRCQGGKDVYSLSVFRAFISGHPSSYYILPERGSVLQRQWKMLARGRLRSGGNGPACRCTRDARGEAPWVDIPAVACRALEEPQAACRSELCGTAPQVGVGVVATLGVENGDVEPLSVEDGGVEPAALGLDIYSTLSREIVLQNSGELHGRRRGFPWRLAPRRPTVGRAVGLFRHLRPAPCEATYIRDVRCHGTVSCGRCKSGGARGGQKDKETMWPRLQLAHLRLIPPARAHAPVKILAAARCKRFQEFFL